MHVHRKESKRGHEEIQPIDHMRNIHGIKRPEECQKTAEIRPRQMDRDVDKIIERTEDFYTELYGSHQST